VALTLLAVYPGLAGVFTGDWWIYYGFLQNLSRWTALGGIPPAWSLAVEASFYLALPFIAMALRRATARRSPRVQLRTDLAVLGGLAVLSLVARTVQRAVAPDIVFSHTLPGSLLWFALGMGLAATRAYVVSGGQLPRGVASTVARPVVAWPAAVLVLVGSTFLGLPTAPLDPHSQVDWFLEHVVYGLVAFLAVAPVALAAGHRGHRPTFLSAPPIAWLGAVSYGIFLWHMPLAGKLNGWLVPRAPEWGFVLLTTATVAVSAAVAAASFYCFERPIMRWGERRRRPAAAARTATGPVVATEPAA
jgi:peptidoglycan/LPS O-acetylase OafA/YrhL